ncbi:uncharacterized protein LOC116337609 [Contarinia nasturtii]|uniref:uncharacterized protein LOC116337609 n=1 Tax=Contarinia nasturtii TaxID=265458 RepID=UPI0012D482D1|nr:uncharacterized protein LOC116337609 [Contarinia nasturtii]
MPEPKEMKRIEKKTLVGDSKTLIGDQTTRSKGDLHRSGGDLGKEKNRKQNNYRVVAVVAGNSEAVTLYGLSPDTQYQLTVTAVWSGKKYRSRPIVFRTLEPPRSSPQQDPGALGSGNGPPVPPVFDTGNAITYPDEYGNVAADNSTARELPTVRGVEVGIVVVVLLVWAGAIALFFNRWGKIRMLLPYQPDYKQEQLKVPGTGVCSAGTCNGQHSHQHVHNGWQTDEPSNVIADRCSRSRINSAIFVSSEGRGFDSIEFLRRHGSQSVLCRKARSAENITDEDRKRRFSENREWENDENRMLRETIELEVECHNDGDLSQIEAITSMTPLTSAGGGGGSVGGGSVGGVGVSGVTALATTSAAAMSQITANTASATAASVSTSHSIQQQQQPILQQPQLKHPAPKLTNLPTLSISGPHYETDEIL